jgi:lipopolysaccharide biosynthesis protein
LGIIAPRGHVLDFLHYGGLVKTRERLKLIAELLGITLDKNSNFYFTAGTMFWARPVALTYLNLVPIYEEDFEPEPIEPDGTLVHALERFIGLSVSQSGFTTLEVDENGKLSAVSSKIEDPFRFAQKTD